MWPHVQACVCGSGSTGSCWGSPDITPALWDVHPRKRVSTAAMQFLVLVLVVICWSSVTVALRLY